MKLIPDRFARYLIDKFDRLLLERYPEYRKLKAGQKKLELALTAAKQIQQSILPKKQPTFEGFDIHGRIKPYYGIGGDFYYFHQTPDRLGIAVGDVAGKGLEAALLANLAHAALHAFSETNNSNDVANIFYRLNNFLVEHTSEGSFTSLIYGYLTSYGSFRYCNAGHANPLLFSDGKAREIKPEKETNPNTLLGIFPDLSYDISSLGMNPGNVLAVYSDGAADAIEINGKEDSISRLCQILEDNNEKTAKQISDEIFSYLGKFKKIDDETVVVARRLG